MVCTIEWAWSRNEFLRWLRSVRYLLEHARAVDDQNAFDSAHRPLTAQDATATERSSQQPTPQPPAHQPAGPPTACLPTLLPLASSRPERPTAPATPWVAIRISQQLRVAVPRLTAASKQFLRRPTSSNLATNHSILDRHAQKNVSNTSRMATTEKLIAESRTPVHHTDHDRDAPKDTRQGVPGPSNSAGLVASTTSSGAITTEPAVSPVNPAGTTGTAREDPETSPDDRSSKSSTSFNTGPPTNPRKKGKAKAKPPATPQQQDEPSAEDLASLEDTASQTDADFRQEITRFWENWCRVHVNYKKYQLDIRMRKVGDQRGAISNVTSSAGTSATTTKQPADGPSTTSSSTGQAQTISSSSTASITSPREMAASAAPFNTTELMPELKLRAEELDTLEGPKEDDQTDHPDALQFAEELLPDHFDVEAAAQRALTDQPPQPPANSAGAAGVNSSETANSAASAVGNAGETVKVQFEPPSHISCAASVQSKPPDASTLPPELADEQLSPSEIAFLEDFDIRGAHLLLDEPTYARTLADFRDEIMVFWDCWCQYHPKAPMPSTEEWTRHKLGKFLFARYQRQWPEVVYRDIADHQDQNSALMFYKAAMNHLRTITSTDVLTDDQAALALDALRSSLPPRGPRADLVD